MFSKFLFNFIKVSYLTEDLRCDISKFTWGKALNTSTADDIKKCPLLKGDHTGRHNSSSSCGSFCFSPLFSASQLSADFSLSCSFLDGFLIGTLKPLCRCKVSLRPLWAPEEDQDLSSLVEYLPFYPVWPFCNRVLFQMVSSFTLLCL